MGKKTLEYRLWLKGIYYLKLKNPKYLKFRDKLREIKK